MEGLPGLVPPDMVDELELLARVVVAAALAGIIGWEREAANKPAGIRTHMLVGAGSALFVAGSLLILGDALSVDARGDAVRIPAAIVTGVGFLGAGAIMRSDGKVSGLTTAAGIWVVAAIGLLIGSGFWVIGVGATVVVALIVNVTALISSRTEQADSSA